ncbi:MAG: hypothetical protein ACO3PR_12710, partial [Limisphaerales bacterium]
MTRQTMLMQDGPDTFFKGHQRGGCNLRRIDGARTDSSKVVALLPLEGKYGAVGTQVRQALEFGLERAGGGIEL